MKDSGADKEAWMDNHAEEVVFSKRMSQLDEQYEETMVLKE